LGEVISSPGIVNATSETSYGQPSEASETRMKQLPEGGPATVHEYVPAAASTEATISVQVILPSRDIWSLTLPMPEAVHVIS